MNAKKAKLLRKVVRKQGFEEAPATYTTNKAGTRTLEPKTFRSVYQEFKAKVKTLFIASATLKRAYSL